MFQPAITRMSPTAARVIRIPLREYVNIKMNRQLAKMGISHFLEIPREYPFNTAANLWRTIGADGYAPDAATAVDVARRLVGKAA